MFKKATPFKQLIFIFKHFGLQPKLISRTHKIFAFIFFIPFELTFGAELIFGSLMILSSRGIRESSDFSFHLMALSNGLEIWLKLIYFFRSFEKMKTFKRNMSKAFKESGEIFDTALKSSSTLSLVYFIVYLSTGVFATTFSWFTKSTVILTWKPAVKIDEDLWFVLHFLYEAIGIFYNIVISSAMDLFPFCLMIMFQSYFKKLNKNIRNIKNKNDLVKCIESHKKIKALIKEFEGAFSPLILIRACMMVLLFGSTLMMITSVVSRISDFYGI